MVSRSLLALPLLILLAPTAAALTVEVDTPTTAVCPILRIDVDWATLATTIELHPECIPRPGCIITTWFVIGSGAFVDLRSDRAGVITGQGHDDEWNWGSWYTGLLCDGFLPVEEF